MDIFQKAAEEIKVYLTFYFIKSSQLREDLNPEDRRKTWQVSYPNSGKNGEFQISAQIHTKYFYLPKVHQLV